MTGDPLSESLRETTVSDRRGKGRRAFAGSGLRDIDSVLDSLQEAIFALGTDGTIQMVNAAATRVFGIPQEGWLGMPVAQLPMAPGSAARLDDLYNEAVRQDGRAEGELLMHRQSGDAFPAETSVVLQRDEGGIETGRILVFRDISHRKHNEEQILRRTRQLTILHEVGNLVNRQLDVDTVLSSTLERLCQLVRCDVTAFYINDPYRQRVDLRFQDGAGFTAAQLVLARQDDTAGPEWRTAQTRQVVYYEDLQNTPNVDAVVMNDAKIRAAAYVPIEARGRLFGVLVLGRQAHSPFSGEDIDLFLPLGQLLATAVENAQLVDGLKRLNEQLLALHELSSRLASNVSEAHAEEQTLSALMQILAGRVALLFVPDRAGRALTLQSAVGLSESFQRKLAGALVLPLEPPHADDPVCEAFASHRLAESLDVATLRETPAWRGLFEHTRLESLMAAPVTHRDQILGVLCVGFPAPRTLGEDERRVVRVALRGAGAFIANARMLTDLQEHRRHLAHLSSRILTAQEEERRHLSRELHDGIGQSLSALKLGLEMMARTKDGQVEERHQHLRRTLDIAADTIAELRRISHDLRPSILDDLGLIPTLRWFAKRFTEQTNVMVTVNVTGEGRRLSSQQEVNMYRIVQEGLNNAVKHGRASTVLLDLQQGDDNFRMTLTDDGCGFDSSILHSGTAPTGLGLASIQERVNLMAGRFSIKTAKSSGASLVIEVTPAGDPFVTEATST